MGKKAETYVVKRGVIHETSGVDIEYLTIPEAIKMLELVHASHPEGRLEFEELPEYGSSCGCPRYHLILRYTRPETDLEYEGRLNTYNAYREARRQQYETLKKEFGE